MYKSNYLTWGLILITKLKDDDVIYRPFATLNTLHSGSYLLLHLSCRTKTTC